MTLDQFLQDGRFFDGVFRPFGQGGYMATHTSPAKDMPGGLCRALSCAFVTYNYSTDDNQPFWLDSELYASKKFFSALGASKEANYAGYGTLESSEKHSKLHDDLTAWQAAYQAKDRQSEDQWKKQIQDTLELVSTQFMKRPLKVLNSTESLKADKHLALSLLFKDEPRFYLHSPGGHHMTSSIVRAGKYKFFDPNYGQLKFTDKKKFVSFVRTYFNRDAFQAWAFSCGV